MLSEKYQNEQKELETKIRQLHETMEAAVQTAAEWKEILPEAEKEAEEVFRNEQQACLLYTSRCV